MMNNSNNEFDKTESTLFGASEQNSASAQKKPDLIKKQRRAIVILALAIAAAILVYAFVVMPIINAADETPEEQVELLDGEVLGAGNRIMLFEHFERDDIGKIEISNEYGEYGFYFDETDGAFYIIDHPDAPYDSTLFASLVVSTGYTLSNERINTDCEDMSEYGLADAQSPASFTLTSRGGEVHTVYIGDMTPSGSGYYARYEGRNAVYILASSIGDTVLVPFETHISPMLALPMAQNDYFMIEKFTLMRGKDVALQVTYLDEAEQAAAASISAYKMLAPADYAVNTTNYVTALESLMELKGTSTLVYAPSDEDLIEYGLAEAPFSIHYNYQGIDQSVIFSEKNENGNYYAYSLLFDLIAEVDGSKLAWLEWETIKWVDQPIFMMNINDIKRITLESDSAVRVFELDGVDSGLTVAERETGLTPDVSNFRKFYRVLLMVYLQNYVSEDLDAESVLALENKDNLYLTLKIETRAGKVTEFKFYPYSTRRAYYTVNGEGEFYVLRDMVTKVISDAEKVMSGETVDPDAHS